MVSVGHAWYGKGRQCLIATLAFVDKCPKVSQIDPNTHSTKTPITANPAARTIPAAPFAPIPTAPLFAPLPELEEFPPLLDPLDPDPLDPDEPELDDPVGAAAPAPALLGPLNDPTAEGNWEIVAQVPPLVVVF